MSLLKSVAKKIAYVVAAFIIFTALVVSITRLLTPILDQHRADFENWASELLATPVAIKEVRASWFGYQPEINFNKVTIFNKNTKAPILQIQKISVYLSIPQSILQRKFVPDGIIISGASVNLRQTAKGEIVVQGISSLSTFKEQQNETKFSDIVALLSAQPRLMLSNVDIHYQALAGQEKFLTLYNLNFSNSNTEHMIFGKAMLHQEIPTDVTIAIQWMGAQADLAQIDARIYLYVSGFSFSQWLSNYQWQGWQIKKGLLSAKIWATWNHNAFQKIQSTFQLYDLNLYSTTDQSTHIVPRLSGNVGWKQENHQMTVAGDDLLIDLPEHLWPVTSFYALFAEDEKKVFTPKTARIGYVDLKDLQTFLFSSPIHLSTAARNIFSTLQIKGALQNADIIFGGPITDLNHLSLNANVSQLSFSPWQQLPGITNVSGVLHFKGQQGDLMLQSHRLIFKYNSIFSNPIYIDQLTGDINFVRQKDESWLLNTKSVQIFNNDLSAIISGSFTIPKNTLPIANINANFTMQKASNITHYLPMHIFDDDLRKWLREAFLSGEVSSATAILRGPLKDFPFEAGNGTFFISGVVQNVDLHFAPDWPLLQHINGKLTFAGRRVIIDVNHGDILGIPLTSVHGEIPYLGDNKPQYLNIQSNVIQTDFAQGLKFIHESPLQDSIGKIFTGINITGPMQLTLGLDIPLKDPSTTKVKGDIVMKDNVMNLTPWHLQLNQLQGDLAFSEKSVFAKNIQAQFFNKPLTLKLNTIQKNKNLAIIQADVNSQIAMNDLESWLKIPFTKLVQGSTNIHALIDLSLKSPIEIHLQSDLLGVSINSIMSEYAKDAPTARYFSADIFAPIDQDLRMKLNYGNLISAALTLKHQQDQLNLTSANLRLGKGEATWPQENGLFITGDFEKLDWDKIKVYMSLANGENTSGAHIGGNFANLPLRNVDIYVRALDLFGENLSRVRLQVLPKQNAWSINVKSDEVVGQIELPTHFTPQELITAQFQKLSLRGGSNLSHQTTSNINVKSLPAILFNADDVSYNDMKIGHVTFKTISSGSGMAIQHLRIYSSALDLEAVGQWSQTNYTRLQGHAKTPQVTDLLDSLGVNAANFEARDGKLNFNLTWHDAPFAPSLAALNGNASLSIGKGRIVNVGAASGAKMDIGKMLSIFSLQSIPRRLSLDFSDIFQKGYSFDSLRGDFSFQNGNAYTNNLRFTASVANLSINGRIGLKDKDYDFTLSVTPLVNVSGIPLAAVLITGANPIVGLAATAVSAFISPGVSKAATYYYLVKGPWDNPTWEPINSVNKK